jgi:8-oxo-dGTP pyrophosphatase MutT (NUDIX family)
VDDYSELSGDELPDLIRGEAVDPAQLGGPGAELSTGLALTWRRHLVFALQPSGLARVLDGQGDRLPFIAVGGHLEPGEAWFQAVQREAREEAGCEIALGDSPVTYLCGEAHSPEPMALRWSEPYRPLLLWLATFPIQRGDAPPRPISFVNAVFRAAALSAPAPSSEMRALLLLDWDLLRTCYTKPLTWEEVQHRGGSIIGQLPPPETVLVPHGSAYFLGHWLHWQDS